MRKFNPETIIINNACAPTSSRRELLSAVMGLAVIAGLSRSEPLFAASTGRVESRLAELGITLPAAPAPLANYVASVVEGNAAYIAGQIGGGGASLNVNSVTAGSVFISSNIITTTTGGAVKMNATFDFRGGVIGLPLAFNYFLN